MLPFSFHPLSFWSFFFRSYIFRFCNFRSCIFQYLELVHHFPPVHFGLLFYLVLLVRSCIFSRPFSLVMWHLVATIWMIFLRINWPKQVQFTQYELIGEKTLSLVVYAWLKSEDDRYFPVFLNPKEEWREEEVMAGEEIRPTIYWNDAVAITDQNFTSLLPVYASKFYCRFEG